MNWVNLAFMNGQQAPTSRPTVSERQSRRLDPVQTASMNRNFTVGHTSATMMMMLTSVRAVLNGPSNSRARVRRRGRARRRRRLGFEHGAADVGGLRADRHQRSATWIWALYQFISALVKSEMARYTAMVMAMISI